VYGLVDLRSGEHNQDSGAGLQARAFFIARFSFAFVMPVTPAADLVKVVRISPRSGGEDFL
jgi:hypothetical protein